MSHEGRLRRGEEYHRMRDIDQNYPKGVTENPGKMLDLNTYLDSIKKDSGEKGVLQNDLHLGNFLLRGNSLFVIDPGQMRFFYYSGR